MFTTSSASEPGSERASLDSREVGNSPEDSFPPQLPTYHACGGSSLWPWSRPCALTKLSLWSCPWSRPLNQSLSRRSRVSAVCVASVHGPCNHDAHVESEAIENPNTLGTACAFQHVALVVKAVCCPSLDIDSRPPPFIFIFWSCVLGQQLFARLRVLVRSLYVDAFIDCSVT